MLGRRKRKRDALDRLADVQDDQREIIDRVREMVRAERARLDQKERGTDCE